MMRPTPTTVARVLRLSKPQCRLQQSTAAARRPSTATHQHQSKQGEESSVSQPQPSKAPHHPMSPSLPAALTISSDIVVERAKGSWLYASDGRKVLDFTCGIGVTNLGHSHPTVLEAAQKQMQNGVHIQVNCMMSQAVLDLAKRITSLDCMKSAQLDQLAFSNTGSEAVENAVKLARHYTKKTNVITFQGSFHGRSITTGAMTNSKTVYRSGFQPAPSGFFVAPYPYCHRCPVAQSHCNEAGESRYSESNCCLYPLEQLKLLLKQQSSPDETAAIIFEPLLGEGGYVPPPKAWVEAVAKLAKDNNILLIVDEVQSGYGRTGKMFAFEHYGLKPDIVVLAKGIANGFPLSAIVTRGEIMSKQKPGSIGGTYSGNALSAAAGKAVLDVFEQDNVLSNVNERGQQFMEGLQKLASKYGVVGDIRGKGLMIAVEFKDSVGTGVASKVQKAMLKRDILCLTTSVYETLRMIPPLTVTDEEISIALKGMDEALGEVFGQQ